MLMVSISFMGTFIILIILSFYGTQLQELISGAFHMLRTIYRHIYFAKNIITKENGELRYISRCLMVEIAGNQENSPRINMDRRKHTSEQNFFLSSMSKTLL